MKNNDKSGKLPDYILAFGVSYIISSFIGAALFPIMNNIDYNIINFLVGLAAFWFLGIILWPLYSSYNFFTFLIFSVLAFLLINGTFEYIIGYDRKSGDLPMDEGGLLKRIKRARILFACSIVIILVMAGLFIYERREQVKEIDSIQMELDVIEEKYERLKGQYSDIRSERNEMRPELNFWQDYAVIVTEYGEKYHTYGCQYVEGRTFWIYNIDAAIGRGYEPCSVCDPPRG